MRNQKSVRFQNLPSFRKRFRSLQPPPEFLGNAGKRRFGRDFLAEQPCLRIAGEIANALHPEVPEQAVRDHVQKHALQMIKGAIRSGIKENMRAVRCKSAFGGNRQTFGDKAAYISRERRMLPAKRILCALNFACVHAHSPCSDRILPQNCPR